tara:strand:+ start:609 stop:812 length:204 start_codon:yes stop_codon:yes gene_type:complete
MNWIINGVKSIIFSVSDILSQLAMSIPTLPKKKEKQDEPNYLGGGASTEIPQSFHVDRTQNKGDKNA